jgi:hypothetical protein
MVVQARWAEAEVGAATPMSIPAPPVITVKARTILRRRSGIAHIEYEGAQPLSNGATTREIW